VIAGSGALLFGLLAVAVVVAARHAPGLGARVGRRLSRVGAFVEALGSGLGAASDPRRLLLAGAAGFGPALTSALAYGLALRSFGVGAGLVGGAVILGVVTLGQFTPGLPVGTGVYWFLCSWAARQLGAAADDAAALAALSHASTVAAHLVVGASSALFRRRDLAALLRERRAGAAARREAEAIADARQPARESV
jgi:glycosyltransferase 2 family protein